MGPGLSLATKTVRGVCEPQSLEVVVGGHHREPGRQLAARQQQRDQPRGHEVGTDDQVRPKRLDRPNGRGVVEPVPDGAEAPEPERHVIRVVTPLDQPRHRLHQVEVRVVIEVAVQVVGRLQQVQPADQLHRRVLSHLVLENPSRRVVPRADTRGQDQNPPPHQAIVRLEDPLRPAHIRRHAGSAKPSMESLRTSL